MNLPKILLQNQAHLATHIHTPHEFLAHPSSWLNKEMCSSETNEKIENEIIAFV